jgi:hypothetical protein
LTTSFVEARLENQTPGRPPSRTASRKRSIDEVEDVQVAGPSLKSSHLDLVAAPIDDLVQLAVKGSLELRHYSDKELDAFMHKLNQTGKQKV